MVKPILKVEGLKTYFYTEDGVVKAVDGVSFELEKGETLGIVGESGCGKSVTAYSLMRLVPDPPGKIVSGKIEYKGLDLRELNKKQMSRIRGDGISMIFQEPMASLTPVYTVGKQIVETIMTHQDVDKDTARGRAVQLLKDVGIPAPESRVDVYPHELSGGMCQRVMIALALSCHPDILIADEPTTALDVTVQAQILQLMNDLKRKYKMTIIIITHDLGVIAEMSDKIGVMYAGKLVEYADAYSLFSEPLHPYTLRLINSVPRLDTAGDRLITIPGRVPNPLALPQGCRFNNRCDLADHRCRSEEPGFEKINSEHFVSCFNSKQQFSQVAH